MAVLLFPCSSSSRTNPRSLSLCSFRVPLLLFFLSLVGAPLSAQISPPQDAALLELQDLSDSPEKVDRMLDISFEKVRSDPVQATLLAEDALNMSLELPYRLGEAKALNRLGNFHLILGTYAMAGDFLQAGLEIFLELGDKDYTLISYNDLTVFYIFTHDYDQASKFGEKAARAFYEENNRDGLASALNRLGIIYDYKGDYVQAIAFYQRSLRLNESLGNLEAAGSSLNNLATVYDILGDEEQSIAYTRQSLALQEELNDSIGMLNAYSNMGSALAAQGKDSLALVYFHRILRSAPSMGHTAVLGNALGKMGKIYEQRGDYDLAIEHYEASVETFSQTQDSGGIAGAMEGLASIYLDKGETRKALSYALPAYTWSKQTDHLELLHRVTPYLADIYQRLGNFPKAYRFQKEYQTLNDSLHSNEIVRKSTAEAFRLQNEREQAQEAMVQQEREARRQAEIDRQRMWNNIYIAGMVLMVLALIAGYLAFRFQRRNNRRLRNTNVIISQQKDEIMYLNQNLEALVAKRTEQLEAKNAQLSDYVFTNSHRVRGPIARILGLMQVRKANGFSTPAEQEQLFEFVERAAKEADDVIFEIGSTLESQDGSS